jgi:hypothetical protein
MGREVEAPIIDLEREVLEVELPEGTSSEGFSNRELGSDPVVDAFGRHAAVLYALRILAKAQTRFSQGDLDRNGTHDYAGSLDLLRRHGLIDEELASGQKGGYRFKLTSRSQGNGFEVRATPVEGTGGALHFKVAEDGVIHSARSPEGPWKAVD